MQGQMEDDPSKVFKFGPLRGRPECFYDHVPQCQDDPNCFRSACGYCHPERDSRNTRWTWVYPTERPQYPQALHPREIKGKSDVPCNLDFLDGPFPRPYNPWSFNSTDLRKDFGSSSPIQRPVRFSSALKIESPREIEKQAQFFAQESADKVVQDKDKIVQVQEKDKVVQDKDKEIKISQDKEVAQSREKEDVQVAQKALNEPTPSPSISNSNLATIPSEKVSVISPATASNNDFASAPKVHSLSETNRAEFNFKSKSLQKEPLSHVSSDATKQLRIRKLVGHEHEHQGRVQFSLKGGSSDAKLSKPSQPIHLEKTHRLDTIKKESSSQLLDTDASPPIQEQSWLEMFILFWVTCGKKMRMLMVALCALFAVIFHRVMPKRARSSGATSRDNSVRISKSLPAPSLPQSPTPTK